MFPLKWRIAFSHSNGYIRVYRIPVYHKCSDIFIKIHDISTWSHLPLQPVQHFHHESSHEARPEFRFWHYPVARWVGCSWDKSTRNHGFLPWRFAIKCRGSLSSLQFFKMLKASISDCWLSSWQICSSAGDHQPISRVEHLKNTRDTTNQTSRWCEWMDWMETSGGNCAQNPKSNPKHWGVSPTKNPEGTPQLRSSFARWAHDLPLPGEPHTKKALGLQLGCP